MLPLSHTRMPEHLELFYSPKFANFPHEIGLIYFWLVISLFLIQADILQHNIM